MPPHCSLFRTSRHSLGVCRTSLAVGSVRAGLDDLLLRSRPVRTVHERLQHQDLPDLVLEGAVELQNGRDSLPVGEFLDVSQNDVPGLLLVGLREILREAVHNPLQRQLRHLLDRIRDLHGVCSVVGFRLIRAEIGPASEPIRRVRMFGSGANRKVKLKKCIAEGHLGERKESSLHYIMSCAVDIRFVFRPLPHLGVPTISETPCTTPSSSRSSSPQPSLPFCQ